MEALSERLTPTILKPVPTPRDDWTKGFQELQQKVRELHVRAHLPVVLDTLAAGGSVTFKYLGSGAVWGKRMSGTFVDVTTQPILVTRSFLEVVGFWSMQALVSTQLSWGRRV
ncbi:hypothetical protein PS862_04137 [Pseudomonas fluorescens]|uniref:Uncharacterized protein n=2 Tax=Pseudomonas fluorescens TaxID=294 RepID=A0A5E7MPC3_PSEFL|nr:hypothetical protein PS862_04137 [Pseudomonas fluorescens]